MPDLNTPGTVADGIVESADPSLELDIRVPSIARVYDYWLSGKDNFVQDRALGDAVRSVAPWIVRGVEANRDFLGRAVKYLAGTGITQFLDVGAGLPTRRNVHEVAQNVNPECRVVYVDNDPLVLAHARALLAVNDVTRVEEGDLRDPGGILESLAVREHLDWSQPVAVLLVSMLHFMTDAENPAGVVEAFRRAVVPGSFLVISHVTPGNLTVREGMSEAVRIYNAGVGHFTPRTPDQVRSLLVGWKPIGRGLVPVEHWRAPRTRPGRLVAVDEAVPMVACVARPIGESAWRK